jgi:U6 snRNA-associated Sm-like protein LSm2
LPPNDLHLIQHFFSFFKTLIGKTVTVELKNDLSLSGQLHSVDQYLNIKLTNLSVADAETKYPHLINVNNVFIRGSTVRYIVMSPADVDTQLLQDAARRANRSEK